MAQAAKLLIAWLREEDARVPEEEAEKAPGHCAVPEGRRERARPPAIARPKAGLGALHLFTKG